MNLDWDSEGEENLENIETNEEPVEGFTDIFILKFNH